MGMSRTAHISLAGLSAIAVAYGLARYGFGIYLPVFRETFGLSTEALGFLASGAYASYLVALLVTGFVAAHVGPKVPVLIGGLTAAAGMGIIAIAQSPVTLGAGVLLAGSSAGWSWAPFSDAVDREVPGAAQHRALGVISTGTTFGLLICGPIALAGGASWRTVWFAFSACALASTAYNAWLLPHGPSRRSRLRAPSLDWRWFLCPKSAPLFAAAFFQSLAGAVYWTYAVDLVRANGLARVAGPVLWILVGAAGIAGVATGDLITRLGLRRILALSLGGLAAGLATLGAAPSTVAAVGLSAICYGAGFMVTAAVLVTWSSRVFAARPSTGFSATMLVLAAGAITGPAAAGLLAARAGLDTVFLLTAAVTLASIAVARPHPDTLAALPPTSP